MSVEKELRTMNLYLRDIRDELIKINKPFAYCPNITEEEVNKITDEFVQTELPNVGLNLCGNEEEKESRFSFFDIKIIDEMIKNQKECLSFIQKPDVLNEQDVKYSSHYRTLGSLETLKFIRDKMKDHRSYECKK